jgi:hypothetical protein
MFLTLRTQILLVMMAPAIAILGATAAHAASIVPGSLTDGQFRQIMANGQFKETFVTEGRIGDNGTNRTFEQSLLRPTSATNPTLTPITTGQRTWTRATPVAFELTYDGTLLQYTIGNQTLSTTTITGGATDMFIRTRAAENSRIDLNDMVFTDATGSTNLELSSIGGTGVAVDYLHLNKIKGAFKITGTSMMDWIGTNPKNSELIYQFKVGTSKSTPEPTTLGALATIVGGALVARRRKSA